MGGFRGFDDYLHNASSLGNYQRTAWMKSGSVANTTVGDVFCLARSAGVPAPDTLYDTTTNLAFQSVSYETQLPANGWHGGIYHGPVVGANGDGFKQVVAASLVGNLAGLVVILVDLLGFARITSVTTSGAQTIVDHSTFTADAGTDVITHAGLAFANGTKVQLTTTGTLPGGLALSTYYWTIRQSSSTSKLAATYADAIAGTAVDITDAGSGTHTAQTYLPRYSDGAGVQSFFFNPSVVNVMGGSAPTIALSSYTNERGDTGRVTAAGPTGTASAKRQMIVHSGTILAKTGPFLPLQGGDSGIRSIESIALGSSYTSGELVVALVKPIAQISSFVAYTLIERNLIHEYPSIERVYDGACILPLVCTTSAANLYTPITGSVDFAWS